MNKLHVRGYSLIELILVITMIGIIGGIGATILGNGLKAYTTTSASLDELNQLRMGMERIARELRETGFVSGAAQINTPFSASQIVFTKSDGNTVTIALSAGTVNLTYSTPAASGVLLRNVSAMNFTYKQNDGATAATATNNVGFIDISVSATVASGIYTRATRIALRNI